MMLTKIKLLVEQKESSEGEECFEDEDHEILSLHTPTTEKEERVRRVKESKKRWEILRNAFEKRQAADLKKKEKDEKVKVEAEKMKRFLKNEERHLSLKWKKRKLTLVVQGTDGKLIGTTSSKSLQPEVKRENNPGDSDIAGSGFRSVSFEIYKVQSRWQRVKEERLKIYIQYKDMLYRSTSFKEEKLIRRQQSKVSPCLHDTELWFSSFVCPQIDVDTYQRPIYSYCYTEHQVNSTGDTNKIYESQIFMPLIHMDLPRLENPTPGKEPLLFYK
ncbi:hypothetical protein BDB01DRAFT_830729 [Pilobolus umbonatus]|nr:hypothetical protein BDB01DRAFT_830729 [Pilobolus umbonatus]